jgi:DNA invertase Pin-like site-specific DNA recombinase
VPLRLDGYIRVSRVGGREGEGYISPDEQRDWINGYGRELSGEITAWHDDQDYSGANTERPGFEAMLGRLERGETDGIVVMAVDRFARSTADGARIVKEIVDRGQIFASCKERMDPRTPEGAYMLRSFFSNAELFLDQMRARWESAKGRAIARGAHIGPTPHGYLKVEPVPTKPTHISPVDSAALGGPTAPGLLVPSPTFALPMKELFERGATGKYGDTLLANWLTERAPRVGGAPWNSSEVRRWFRNRIYLGEVRYGATLVNTSAHKELTTEEIWHACQREPRARRVGSAEFLLSGLIRCAGCRYAMGGAANGGSTGLLRIYRCSRSNRGCPSPSVITADRAEAFVLELVEQRHRSLLLGQVEDDEAGGEAIAAYDAASVEVEAFVADVEARALMGDAVWQEGLRVRVEARDSLRAARDQAIARSEVEQLASVSIEDLERHDLRDLLTGLVRHVFVRRAGRAAPASVRLLIVWSDDLAAIDIPGRHNTIGPFEPIGW